MLQFRNPRGSDDYAMPYKAPWSESRARHMIGFGRPEAM